MNVVSPRPETRSRGLAAKGSGPGRLRGALAAGPGPGRSGRLRRVFNSAISATIMAAYLSGFTVGFSLILAIGAQNAFVLRQGLRGSHVFAVCLTCAVSDALLIAAGVAGFAAVAEAAPWVKPVFLWGGVAFLTVYGLMSLRSAWRGGHAMPEEGQTTGSLGKAVLTCLAFTWLNPHVYLDTLVLIGSLATAWNGERLLFGAGAVSASFVFFFSLGYAAGGLAPIFRTPRAWRMLDGVVGIVMLALAAGLATNG